MHIFETVYKLGQAGNRMKCPYGLALVTSQDECKNAAKALGKKYISTDCYGTETPGCFSAPDVYFSTCSKKTLGWNHAAVCTHRSGMHLMLRNEIL